MIGHHKHILLIGINDFDALVSYEELLFLPFLESKFLFQLGKTLIRIIISLLFMIGHCKHVFLVGINDFDGLVLEEKLLFLPFLESKFIFQLGKTWVHIIISFPFMIGHNNRILLVEINDFDALVSKENIAFYHF